MAPRPLFDTPAGPPANSGRDAEPRPLVFGPSSAAPAATPAPSVPPSGREPGALRFAPAAPAAQPDSAERKAPAALALPERASSPALAAGPAGRALFDLEEHPAQAAAEAAMRRLEPGLADAEALRLRRFVQQLLPISLERLQDYADPALRAAQQHALDTASLTARFSRMGAAELLQDAVDACSLKAGLVARIKARFAALDAIRPRIEALRDELATLASVVRGMLTRSDAQGHTLALHLLALRAVEQVAGAPASSALLHLLHQRLDLLRAATTQARLVGTQLQQLQSTLASLETQCEHLLTVTLSAVELARSTQRR